MVLRIPMDGGAACLNDASHRRREREIWSPNGFIRNQVQGNPKNASNFIKGIHALCENNNNGYAFQGTPTFVPLFSRRLLCTVFVVVVINL